MKLGMRKLRRRYGRARVAVGPGDVIRRVPHPNNPYREDAVVGIHSVGYVELDAITPRQYKWVAFEDDGIKHGFEPTKTLAFMALRQHVRGGR